MAGRSPGKLDKIENYAGQLITNMREIIWAMNSSYDNLSDLIIYIRQFLVEYLEIAEIKCKAQLPEITPTVSVGGKKRKNLFLCIKECAHNIVKHADASLVDLIVRCDGEELIIEIKDNGKGITSEKLHHFGNGLKNMEKRMKGIGGNFAIENDNGTRVTLSLMISESNNTIKNQIK